MTRGTRGAYRKEDRVALPANLQKELVEKAAAKYGNCQELAKHLDIPKSSVHYYRTGRLTMPISVLERLLETAGDEGLIRRVSERGITKDRSWATEYAQDVFREMCREKVRLPTKEELVQNDDLRRKAARIVSYVLAEGSVWLQKEKFGEHAANITFSSEEGDLYRHFRGLCRDLFNYDIGPPQKPGNDARAIRGFIYSRFIAEWLVENGVTPGEKAETGPRLPKWVMESTDIETWISALQPLFDGEGCARVSLTGFGGFVVGQSRHSMIDFDGLPRDRESPRHGRTLSTGALKNRFLYGVRADDFFSMSCRSELLDDAFFLSKRLGLNPRMKLSSVYLKDDGFWSCAWTMSLPRSDSQQLLAHNLVTQELKRYAIVLFAY